MKKNYNVKKLNREAKSAMLISLISLSALFCFNTQARAENPFFFQQQQSVTGHVVDSSGQSLSGVSVHVKGSSKATVTNSNGEFSIDAKAGDVLVIAFVGYESQEVTATSHPMHIRLKATNVQLSDVVVIGYGVQKKSLVTGAIAQVTAKDMANKEITRLDDALRGQAAGVMVTQSSGIPGSAPTVRVRGTTTLNNSDPLYVVDGVVMNGGIDYLNPNDIASIEIMKDAASGAIYGTQAANGVIIITTKKGALNSPMRVNYNMQLGLQGPIRKVKMANATQYAELMNETAINDGNPIPFPSPTIYGSGTNWQDQIFSNNAQYQNHNISLSGGTDKSTYFLSAGYMGQQGIIAPKTTYNNSFSLTANTSFKVGKYVSVGENLSYTYRKNNTSEGGQTEFGGPLSSALNLDPITPVTVDPDFVVANPTIYPTLYQPYLVKVPNGDYYSISPYVGQELSNPLADIKSQTAGNYSWSHNLIGNAYINVNPIKGLNLRSQISVKKAFYGNESTSNMPPYYLGPQHLPNILNDQYRQWWQNMSWNWDNTISYGRQLGLHNFEVMVGTSAMKQNGANVGATLYGEPVNNYQDASFNWGVANPLIYTYGVNPDFTYKQQLLGITLNPDGTADSVISGVFNAQAGYGGDDQIYTLNSYFGRVSYNYAEKYLFMGIIRRDGSSKFGANNRWGTFPSAQVGWVVTKEKFFPQNTPIDNLKIRASYGVVGNDMSLGTFQFISLIASGGNRNAILGNNNYTIGYGPSAPSNANLKWERTSSFDIGFDAALFRNVTVAFDYYNKKTTGILEQIQIPSFAGSLGQPWANSGDMVNKGVELELGYRKNFGRDFRLNVSGNISYNKNTVTYLADGKEYLDGGQSWHTSAYPLTRTAVGHPIAAFYGFKELGTFKSQAEINSYGYTDAADKFQLYQPKAQPGDLKFWKNPNNTDDNGQGVIGQGDRTWIGDPTPHWIYGINVNFGWKNWDLLVFGQGVWGNKIFQAYRRRDVSLTGGAEGANEQVGALNAWTPANANSNYPRLTYADPNGNFTNPSDFYLQNGAFFRLRTLQIGYTVPKAWLDAIKFQTIRIYVSATNLFTLTKYNGYDPEIGGGLTGIDKGIYPPARTFILGLNIGL